MVYVGCFEEMGGGGDGAVFMIFLVAEKRGERGTHFVVVVCCKNIPTNRCEFGINLNLELL